MSAVTDRPLYFRSFEAALRPPADNGAAGWSSITETALQLLETPWPWDTSCTSMGVCPSGAACAQTTGFAIICAQGIVRDSVEPALEAAREWWPVMLGGASDSEIHFAIAVALVAIMLINLAFVIRVVVSRESAKHACEDDVSGAGGSAGTASRRQRDAAARRRSRRSRQQRASSSSGSESSDASGESGDDSEIVAYKTE